VSRTAMDDGNGLRFSPRQCLIEGGPFHPEGSADSGFAGSSMYGCEDGLQLFGADRLGPSPASPAAPRCLQTGPNAFLRQRAFVLRQRSEDTEQERAMGRGRVHLLRQ